MYGSHVILMEGDEFYTASWRVASDYRAFEMDAKAFWVG